jgi:hypothetical protein
MPTLKLPSIPAPTVAMVDPQTGRLTTVWYNYLRALDQAVRELQSFFP